MGAAATKEAMRPVGPRFMERSSAVQEYPTAAPRAPLDVANLGVAFKEGNPAQTRGAFGAQITLTILVSVALFMLFILAFFFLLTRKVEKKVVSTSVERVVDSLSSELKAVLPAAALGPLGTLIQGLQAPDTQMQDAMVAANNAKLQKLAGTVVGVTAAVVTVIALGVFLGMKAKRGAGPPGVDNYPNPVSVLLSATFGFAAVALCELVFLFGIAGRYQPLDTVVTRNDMVSALIEGIKGLPDVPYLPVSDPAV